MAWQGEPLGFQSPYVSPSLTESLRTTVFPDKESREGATRRAGGFALVRRVNSADNRETCRDQSGENSGCVLKLSRSPREVSERSAGHGDRGWLQAHTVGTGTTSSGVYRQGRSLTR